MTSSLKPISGVEIRPFRIEVPQADLDDLHDRLARTRWPTRPQTLAYGLTDSPVGQLAWIVEKFKEWTGSADVPEDAVDRDLILTNVMLYWLTGTANSSARLYYENMHSGAWPEPSKVPTGVAVFAQDVAIRRFAERTYNIVHWSEFDRGGHFAAMEAPDLLVSDIRKFFRRPRQESPTFARRLSE